MFARSPREVEILHLANHLIAVPERLKYVFIVNAPSMFQWLWAVRMGGGLAMLSVPVCVWTSLPVAAGTAGQMITSCFGLLHNVSTPPTPPFGLSVSDRQHDQPCQCQLLSGGEQWLKEWGAAVVCQQSWGAAG